MKKEIESILDRIRPALNLHEGDVELIKYDTRTKIVYLQFLGTCTDCSISEITLRNFVEKELKKDLPIIHSVVAT